MKTVTAFLKRHSLGMGILLMFAFTWPVELSNAGLLPFQVPFIVSIFVGWGIVLATLLITGLTLGKVGLISLLKRYLLWRVGWRWYLAAFLLLPSLIIGGVYLNAVLTGVPPDYSTVMAHTIFGASASLPLLVVPWFIYEILSNGEEIGWRGYVLPRLQVEHNALAASLILGIIWGFWHLPKFLSHWNAVSFAWFMVHTLAASVLYTWMYNGTKGSLLLVTLFHASTNTAGLFMPLANTVSSENMGSYMIYVLLEVLAALVVVLATGPERLSRTQEKQVQEEYLEPVPGLVPGI
jgi:membrane protease YdiL (CAAX protease family)